MAEIVVGTPKWWAWAAEGGLDVKVVNGAAPTSDRDSREAAKKAGLRNETQVVLRATKVGWNMTKGLNGRGDPCYWHTNDLTRFTTRKMDLLAKLNRAAPKYKRKKQGFTNTKKERRNKKQKTEKLGQFADDYGQQAHVVEAQGRGINRALCRAAAAGRQIGASNEAKSKIFKSCAFLGELYVLMYIGLFNPNIRPLICVCELWWLLDRYGIECEFERWYGWMEDMWYCENGSVAGSGGIAGRLVKLGLGTTTDFANSWPEFEQPADTERVAQLLGVSKESLRGVGPFHKTFLPQKPGRIVYQIHHASRPPWWSRTSCWHRLVATLRNLRRPEAQIYPGRPFRGRAFKPKPDGSEWFAGAGQWCLGPVMRRAALLKIDGSALAPAGFTGPQRTIVIMSLASLYEGRPMYVEVKWHRSDFVDEKATIVLGHALVRLANDESRPLGYAVPAANALKVAASLVASCVSGRARGMWIVVSDYLRKEGWLDVPVTGSAEPYKTWGMRCVGGGVEQLTWRPAKAGHGRPHGVSDAAAERGVHAAAAYGSFVDNRVDFIKAARDIQNTHLALSEEECAAPMACFVNAHADVLKMRAPPHVTVPKYKIDVGAGLVVFTLGGPSGRADADVLHDAAEDYKSVRGDLIDRCWRHHFGNLHRVSDEYAAAVAAAVAVGRRPDDVVSLGAMARVVEDMEDAADAIEEDAVEGTEEKGAEEPGADEEVVDYLNDAAAPTETDLEEGAHVDVNWRSTGSWYVATVKHVHDGGACDVAYDDGDEETEVPLARLRLRAAPDTKSFGVNDLVMANWEGQGDFYEARLGLRNGDGFDVFYPGDGKSEKCVPVSRMRPVREADRKAARKLTLAQYKDPKTKLTALDVESADVDELRAALAGRGQPATGRVDALRTRLRVYLERHAS